MQVGGVPVDLELAFHRWPAGIGQIDHIQRIHLAEGDDVAAVLDEPDRVDALSAPKAVDAADGFELIPVVAQHGHDGIGLGCIPPLRRVGRGDAEVTLPFGHRPLAQHVAGNGAGCLVFGAAWLEGELVDHGVHVFGLPTAVPHKRVDPPGGGDIGRVTG